MIYVDDMSAVFPKRPGWRYHEACHLIADTSAELEAFAKRLGLRKAWRHGDHYDLTTNRRRQAIEAGAVPISIREMVKLRRSTE